MNRLVLAFASAIVMSALSAHGADPPQAPVMMEEMTTTEVRDAIKAGKTTVLIFNGSTEA